MSRFRQPLFPGMRDAYKPSWGRAAQGFLSGAARNPYVRGGAAAGAIGLAGKSIYDQAAGPIHEHVLDPLGSALGEAARGVGSSIAGPLQGDPMQDPQFAALQREKALRIGAESRNRDLANEVHMAKGRLAQPAPPAGEGYADVIKVPVGEGSPDIAGALAKAQGGGAAPPQQSWGDWVGENWMPLGLGAAGLYALHHYLTSRDRDEEKYAMDKESGGLGGLIRGLRARPGGGHRNLYDHVGSVRSAYQRALEDARATAAGGGGAGIGGRSWLGSARDWFAAHPTRPIGAGLVGAGLAGKALGVGEGAVPAAPAASPAAVQPPAAAASPSPAATPEGDPGLLARAGNWVGAHPYPAGGAGLGAIGLLSLLNGGDDEDKEAAAGPAPGLFAFFTRRV